MKILRRVFLVVVIAAAGFVGWHVWLQYNQVKVLNAVIEGLARIRG